MDMMDLLRMGGELMRNNSDDATSGLDVGDIAGALGGILGGDKGKLDIGSLVSGLAQNGLGEIVGSWLGSGENAEISTDQVKELLGSEKISEFASRLGISEESATGALAEILPQIVDKATSEENSLVDEMLDKVGGISGAMSMLGKMLK